MQSVKWLIAVLWQVGWLNREPRFKVPFERLVSTAPGIPIWSPILVLTGPYIAQLPSQMITGVFTRLRLQTA